MGGAQDRYDFSPILTLTGQYAHEWDEPSGIAGRFERDDLLGKLEWRLPCSGSLFVCSSGDGHNVGPMEA